MYNPQNILITGANRGIGLEMVKLFLKQGNTQVFAACRTPHSADDLQELLQSSPENLTIVQLDIMNQDSIQAAVETVSQQTHKLDMLLNNAGIFPNEANSKKLGMLEVDAVSEVVITNSVAPLMVSQAFIDLLKAGENPRLVMITSQMGSMDWTKSGGSYAYRMSKAAMNMAARTLAADRTTDGITTIMIHPGWVQTDMGGPTADITPQASAEGVVKVVNRTTPADNGSFFRWDGSVHPW